MVNYSNLDITEALIQPGSNLIKKLAGIILTLPLILWLGVDSSYAQVLNPDESNIQLLSGQIENPLFCPSNPDIVSYERTDGTGHHLYFYHKDERYVAALETEQDAPQHLLANSDTLMSQMVPYTGQINWRPVLDANGRQWFVYLRGPSVGEAGLYLSYLNADGQQKVSDTYKLSFSQAVETPRWSPDGDALVFVSEGQLYGARNIHDIIYKGEANRFHPVQLTHELHGAYYPAWSPDGRFIAYQSVEMAPGVRNVDIKVIAIPKDGQKGPSRPVNVTRELRQTDEYKPSWSPDGRYLAYYSSEQPQNAYNDPAMDIGVTEIRYDDYNGSINRGQRLSGTHEHIASKVLPNRDRGPDWAVSYEGDKKFQSLVYVTAGNDRQDGRLMSSSLNNWMKKQQNYSIDLSKRLYIDSDDPLYGTTTLLPHHRRFLYLAREDNMENLHVQDLPTPGQPVTIVRELSEQKAFHKSLLFPGLGQLYKGDKAKGILLVNIETGALGALVYLMATRPTLKDRYENWKWLNSKTTENTDPSYISIRKKQLNNYSNALDVNRKLQFIMGGIAVATYGYSLMDVKSGFPLRVERKLSANRSISAGFTPQMAYFNEKTFITPGLNFKLKF